MYVRTAEAHQDSQLFTLKVTHQFQVQKRLTELTNHSYRNNIIRNVVYVTAISMTR